jgi:integrase
MVRLLTARGGRWITETPQQVEGLLGLTPHTTFEKTTGQVHTFRHTYRTWMDANGTPLGIQQDLMRHANISMTTKYGSSMAEGMRAANSAVVRMAIQ